MYYSSANCKVFINNNHVEELYSLEVSKDHGFMPVYAYNQRNWSFLAEGKIIVQGALILNIKDANYLINLISGRVESSPTFSDKEIKASLKALQALTSTTGSVQDVLEVARINTANLSTGTSTGSIDTQNKTISKNLCDISIVNNTNSNIDLVTGVKFVGKSFAVAAGSSQNIKYAFPFVARDLTI